MSGWSLWSKDIIFVVTPDSKSGTQAWIDAYHDMQPASVQPLPLKSGALQGALVIEYPFDHRFESLHIIYDGVNGQLPNLDLINTAVSVAGGQMGIGADLQEMWDHDDSYQMRLQTMLRGMLKQGFGYATGAHSSFIPYHIDAITLQPKGEGWQDEMALGRTVESICRSLNNLLEHLHQSFFFYLLMQSNRFVSIGTYLPSAMLVAGNFTIMALALWLRTGHYEDPPTPTSDEKTKLEKRGSPETAERPRERQLALPLTFVVGLHLLGLVPLYLFNNLSHEVCTFYLVSMPQLTIEVLPLRHQSKHHSQSRPPPSPRRPPNPQLRLLASALFAHQLLLPPHPRPVPVHPCNPKLLVVVHCRAALHATQFRRPAQQPDQLVSSIRTDSYRVGDS